MNINKRYFANLTDLLEKSVQDDPNDLVYRDRVSRDRNVYFNGTARFEDALDMASNGWEDGRKIIAAYAKEYGHIWRKFFPVQDFTKKTSQAVTGDVVLVENFIAGIPEDMMTFVSDDNIRKVEGNSNGKLQRIILNGSVSHFIRPDTILQYGALIAALVRTMEEAGFSVELNIVWYLGHKCFLGGNKPSPNDNVRLMYVLELKRFNENLDIDKLGFCVAHSSMLRRFVFSLMECEDNEFVRQITMENYGYPINLTAEDITSFGGNIENGGKTEGNMYFRLLDNNYTLEQLVEQCTAVVREHFTEVNFNETDKEPTE